MILYLYTFIWLVPLLKSGTQYLVIEFYFTSRTVVWPMCVPRLWEWNADLGWALSPTADVFESDVKKCRLAFVQPATAQRTQMHFFLPQFYLFSAVLQTQWTTAIRTQFAEISRQLRHISVSKKKKKTTSLWALQFFCFHVVGPNTVRKGDSFFKSFSHFLLQSCVFICVSQSTYLALSWFLSVSSCLV